VTGHWRLTFFYDEDAKAVTDLNLLDYH